MEGRKFIDKIGIELEAAWLKPRRDLVVDESFSAADFPPTVKAVGELVSRPLSSKTEILDFLHNNWPDETCPKCAMHVHFSLNHINYYAACMSTKFYNFFLEEMKKWGDNYPCTNELFWDRLNGENRYCRKRFNPDVQVKYREKGHNRQDRRDHWNFCYGLHRTMECRLLPMFKNIDTAISAIDALMNCIEEYLITYTTTETPIIKEIVIEEDGNEQQLSDLSQKIATKNNAARYIELSAKKSLSKAERNELMVLEMNIVRDKIQKSGKPKISQSFRFNYFDTKNAANVSKKSNYAQSLPKKWQTKPVAPILNEIVSNTPSSVLVSDEPMPVPYPTAMKMTHVPLNPETIPVYTSDKSIKQGNYIINTSNLMYQDKVLAGFAAENSKPNTKTKENEELL